MSTEIPANEYAVELPGQGWLHSLLPGTFSLAANPVLIADELDSAREFLAKAQKFYAKIGAASVGDQLQLVVRSVTLIRSDWEKII